MTTYCHTCGQQKPDAIALTCQTPYCDGRKTAEKCLKIEERARKEARHYPYINLPYHNDGA